MQNFRSIAAGVQQIAASTRTWLRPKITPTNQEARYDEVEEVLHTLSLFGVNNVSKPLVLLAGVVRGMQRADRCEVMACRYKSGNDDIYSDEFVLSAPEDLPDGEYQVEFERSSFHAKKVHGLWLSEPERTLQT